MIGRRRGAPDVDERVRLLELVLAVGAERLDPGAVAAARTVLDRTGERLRLGADTTVVALVGATGSGKSSLFNALAGMDIAEVGGRRPTTGKPAACVWGTNGADPLLDWLDVPLRHRTSRESVLDADHEASLHGLVLLDLPDHDSTVVSHRLEVNRLVELVDLLVWVVDPQKYADEALHSGYLKHLAGHEQVMVVVLNQVDRLPPESVEACTRDLRRLLDADGLDGVRVLAASATRGDGVDVLRDLLAGAVRDQATMLSRVAADLSGAAQSLRSGVADREADPDRLPGAETLHSALSQAAGVPVVLDALVADYRRRASGLVGWPPTMVARRLRPDPLRRLPVGSAADDVRRLARSSVPAPTRADGARVDLAVREVTAAAARDLPQRWGDAVRAAVPVPTGDLADALEVAVVGVDLDVRTPAWWRGLAAAQMVLAAAAVAGFCWLLGLAVVSWLSLSVRRPMSLGRVPLPTVMLLGGLALGLLLALVSRWFVSSGAGRRRARAQKALDAAVSAVAQAQVVAPVSAVLADHRSVREALEAASG